MLCFCLFSNINLSNIFGKNKYKIFDQTTYFAVVVASGDTYFDVAGADSQIKQQGGAGYVLNKGGKCHVVANIYASEQDAQKVCENLAESFDASILKLDLSALVLKAEYTAEQITELKNCLQLANLCQQNMYAICLSLDKGEILPAEAKQKLQNFKETCQFKCQQFFEQFAGNVDNVVTNIKIFAREVLSSQNALLLSENLSVDIKYTMCSILSSFANLQTSIAK